MKKTITTWMLVVVFTIVNITLILPKEANSKGRSANRERSEIEDKYKWNLEDIYKTVEDWEKDKVSLIQRISQVEKLKGTLGESAEALYTGLEKVFGIWKDMDKLSLYAALSSDSDTRDSELMRRRQEASKLWTDMGTASSFLEPEILAISNDKLAQFTAKEPRLKMYGIYIEDIKRMEPHTLSSEMEEFVSSTGQIAGDPESTHNILSNAELPFETVTLSDGTEVTVNSPSYGKFRYRPNREDRIKVFNAFFGSLNKFKGTFGNLLYGKLKENLFYSSVRKYNNSLEASLFGNKIPVDVYTNLIKNVKSNLPVLHKYLKIRKKMLGVKELHYYDMYPDLVKGVNIEYTYEEGMEHIKSALNILGEEYSSVLNKAFNSRWIDVFPANGKASGAYSNGAYDVHPYIKLNYNGKFPDVSMLAHELGHTMHSYFSDKNQPYATSYYTSFVAEVAATVNEALLTDHILKTIEDPKEKLSLLGSILESCRQTLFRQTLFAEFELIINQRVEAGETLTDKDFSEIYLGLLREYYGHDEGIMVIDDIYGIEWAYISHFFLGYYNFQYSTSYVAANAISHKILTQGEEAVKDYLSFLSAGSSDDSIPLLKGAGVDMTSEEPFNLTIESLNAIINEMEELLNE